MPSIKVQQFANFIIEREAIRERHDARLPRKDWTLDPIFRRYRFCNVRREDDRVTRWLKKNWRDPYFDSPNMTAAMVLARLINWPPTLEWMGFPEKWEPERMVECIHDMQAKDKAWSSAYVVTTCGKRMDKAVYVVEMATAIQQRPWYSPNMGDTLASVWERLCTVDGLGAGFLAAQVVADLKHVPDSPLTFAPDWWKWAVPGPGSKRGLNRYIGFALNSHWRLKDWQGSLSNMIYEVEPHTQPVIGKLSAQDWQNCLCEFDKYERVRLGQGKPRKEYTPETAYQI